MALVLAAAAAAAVLMRRFNRVRVRNPQYAQDLTTNIHAAATLVGTVASAVSMLLAALWGRQPEPVRAPVPVRRPMQLGEDAA